MCGYWNSLTSGYPSGPVKITKTILESVAAWCYLRGNQALLCFMNVSELIPMSWGKKPVLHSAFRKVLHLQMKVACLPYSCLLNLCSRELVWDIILYLVIWKTNKPKKTLLYSQETLYVLSNWIAVFISTSIVSWFLFGRCTFVKDPIHS